MSLRYIAFAYPLGKLKTNREVYKVYSYNLEVYLLSVHFVRGFVLFCVMAYFMWAVMSTGKVTDYGSRKHERDRQTLIAQIALHDADLAALVSERAPTFELLLEFGLVNEVYVATGDITSLYSPACLSGTLIALRAQVD